MTEVQTNYLENKLVSRVETNGSIPLSEARQLDDSIIMAEGGKPDILKAVGVRGVFRKIGDGRYLVTERSPDGEEYVIEHKVIADPIGPGHYFVENGELYHFNLSRSFIGEREKVEKPTLKGFSKFVAGSAFLWGLEAALLGIPSTKEELSTSLTIPIGILLGIGYIYAEKKYAWNKYEKYMSKESK